MQLPDESIDFQYQNLIASPGEGWSLLQELQAQHFIQPERLEAIRHLIMQVRGQVAAERELRDPPPRMQPLLPGFMDLPQQMLDGFRRKGDASDLGRVLAAATRLRDQTDRVLVLGIGGSSLGAKALFDALCHTYHNELTPKARMGKPRIYFVGNDLDNDALQDLLELLENHCVDPELPEERWGAIAISKSGGTLETAAAYRVLRTEAAKYYGSQSPYVKSLFVPITGASGKFRDLLRAEGYSDEQLLTIPDNVAGRFSVLSPVGMLPAAVMGLDVRAILLGAAAMTRRFLEEPFERNPVLQYAAVHYLMCEELKKNVRVMSVWSRKLESLGFWYDQLVSESLGKQGRGPTPVTAVQSRDLHSRGQQHQEGTRDKIITNLLVKATRHPAIPIGMADRNEDDLNALSRKSYTDLQNAMLDGVNQAYLEAARPTANLILPVLSEHTMGQLLQMLMLATVVEARLMNVNPYGQSGVDVYKRHTNRMLRGG
ncbi:glucose-6-phosphate isomerase [Tuwongella immobilis]|uniref:Glucose-6-phosphate isomerase n=1 Tax=Tuwongella immobilis TaxID=692036 RepID=A0A6C2YK44_9BACT|nr:glucose-6-phosphate isomerase [Tuwongella immobilis]VIP01599.1 glucose-6-phosphate isomerase : Glucose-6-phosphate isomerase OS=Planctomyces brasiliensis (strain ATCC 49424 / DSM 5305 / JCM 21570 / NBRC 103401 / IFAM 1448) GN=Plabr_3532 PE=3 SV=1: PGI [Tuwongella immobilis]VTR98886.1 glucose-6-phosphate isomerase : Glucose-6-phosphate isomerase OS=Planctomyces brasiliensis (strain ATCC 49424 / DSM 5305 / JCM 21570 / NBRC 103401 / IFAM 1448) GN=Plabr_3532 PE=3 SV=1: PGI [Tuwongella immobilis]